MTMDTIIPTPDEREERVAPLQLPVQVPRQTYRAAQSNIPDDKQVRVQLKKLTEEYVERVGATPPLTMDELREYTGAVLREAGLDAIYRDYASILISNAAWRDSLAQIPYDRRLLLIPKCLRAEERCPAPFDEFGLLCKECGLCSIQDLTVEAERLGYAVLVAEGSAIVRSMIETGKIEAIVGVSCINVLEKCFPHMEAAAIPGVAIPLLQDDCVGTTVDLDWVWDLIHLTSDDKTYRLDLDALKTEVRGWFAHASLDAIMGEVQENDRTAQIARDFLSTGGKRWRPYLATCTYMALQSDNREDQPELTADVTKAAVAIECFHKASLIHDDIEDADEQRYGSPALHTDLGVPVALNVGDFLIGEGYRLLAELGRTDMVAVASQGHVTLSRGQGRRAVVGKGPRARCHRSRSLTSSARRPRPLSRWHCVLVRSSAKPTTRPTTSFASTARRLASPIRSRTTLKISAETLTPTTWSRCASRWSSPSRTSVPRVWRGSGSRRSSGPARPTSRATCAPS